jgi:EAL domain-containing protein (putative c-di-GMP-specific phosphodiesterase class I)
LMRTRKIAFLLFSCYGLIHVFLLIPTRLYALATLRHSQWGSRSSGTLDGATESARRQTVSACSAQGMTDAKHAWEIDVRSTVALGDAFVLHAQPIRNLASGDCDEHELLLRMRHDGQVLAPEEFLSIAERHGLLPEVDLWVVREALEVLVERSNCDTPLRVAVNVARQSFTHPAFGDIVGRLLCEAGAPARNLVFEVNERDVLADPVAARRFGQDIAARGCLLALDNVGTQFAGVSAAERGALLARLPVARIKLDGSLVRALAYSEAAQAQLQIIVGQARRAGIAVTAVFVGDEATIRLLTAVGVDHAQGFHIGRAVEIDRSAHRSPFASLTARPVQLAAPMPARRRLPLALRTWRTSPR